MGRNNKKPIMKSLIIAFVLVCCVSCSFQTEVHYRDQKENKVFTGIEALEIKQKGMDVKLSPSLSDTLSVAIRIDDMTLRGIDTENMESPFRFMVEKGKLRIEPTYGGKVKESQGLIAVLVPRSVEMIEVETREGNIEANGIRAKVMDLVSREGSVKNEDCEGWEQMHIFSHH